MREREGLGFTEGDRVGQKNLCGRGGPLIKFTAPGFKGVKVKTPFGGTGHQTMVVGIRENKFLRAISTDGSKILHFNSRQFP